MRRAGTAIGAKVARYLLPLRSLSLRLSLVSSRPLAAITRPIVISDKETPHWSSIFPLVVMPPSVIAAAPRVRLFPGSRTEDSLCACVHAPRSYPESPIGPRGASSVSHWTAGQSISAHPRVCASIVSHCAYSSRRVIQNGGSRVYRETSRSANRHRSFSKRREETRRGKTATLFAKRTVWSVGLGWEDRSRAPRIELGVSHTSRRRSGYNWRL